ncbi:MAG: TetR family transcriptional regulator [Desulfarculaceae bacterium]|jgi:AcrR family transcriptional regulator
MPVTSTFRNLPADKQQRILEEALTQFSEQGYSRTSLNNLVARLGISKGSIFQYFKDKSGLFHQVFEYAVAKVKDHLRGVRESTRGAEVFTRIRLSLLAGLDLMEANPRLFKLYLKIAYEGGLPFRGKLLQSIRIFSRDYLMDLLREGAEAGELSPDLDLEMAAFVVDAVLERFLVASSLEHMDPDLGLYQADRAQAEEKAARLVEMLRQGLGAGR